MKHLLCSIAALLFLSGGIRAEDQDPTRIFTSDAKCTDSRLGPPKTLNGYFPFHPPTDKKAWEARRKAVRP